MEQPGLNSGLDTINEIEEIEDSRSTSVQRIDSESDFDSAEALADVGLRKIEASSDDYRWIPNASKAFVRYDIATFTVHELRQYSNDFAITLGKGGNSTVYKGMITGRTDNELNGLSIAIKASRQVRKEDLEQWRAEIETIPLFDHRNIIKLIGTCETDECLYLVFPLMEKGTLTDTLADLNWKQTLKIIKGVTLALRELHCYAWLVFRDLKSDNILMDKDYTPKLSDFGLVRQEGLILTMGTFGSTDPDVMSGAHAYRSSDIWSLGVLILQLVMKRKKILQPESLLIRDSAKEEYLKNSHAVHGKLMTSCKEKKAIAITRLGIECTKKNAEKRPTVDQVLEVISGLKGNTLKKLVKKLK